MSAPSRRWPRVRFRLWHLLALMTLLCGWLGYETNRARRNARVVKAIQKADGLVGYLHRYNDRKWIDEVGFAKLDLPKGARVNLPSPAPQWLREFIGDQFFVRIGHVTLDDEEKCRELLPEICRFDDMVEFDAAGLSDADVPQLAQLTKLKMLTLVGPVTDASIESLAAMHSLTLLDVKSTDITKRGAGRLEKLMPNCTIDHKWNVRSMAPALTSPSYAPRTLPPPD